MQVSIENLSGLERKMTIAVPSEKVENQVLSRLQEAAKTIRMKGFRQGKVPMKVVRERYGKGVRQEVLGEVMSRSYYEALGQEKVRPAGQPRIEPKSMEEGQDLEFEAIFEVYPDVALQDLTSIQIERKSAEITEPDIDNMVETLRKQRQTWQEVDRVAQEGDQVLIDFEGRMDGEIFEGGSSKGSTLVLGSGRMIEGFETGLIGAGKDEEKVLNLNFPENYHKPELAGKPVEFRITVRKINTAVLPDLDDSFFESFDIREGGLEAFRAEVKSNMARELKNAIRSNLRNQVVEGLLKTHEVQLPKALVANEIKVLRDQAVQQYGGGQQKIDPSMLPDELFRDQAGRRVSLGLIMNEIISSNELKVDPQLVRRLVEELAESYEQPQDVIKWYYSNEDQLAQVEAMAMEEVVIDFVMDKAKVNEVNCSYEEALKASTKTA